MITLDSLADAIKNRPNNPNFDEDGRFEIQKQAERLAKRDLLQIDKENRAKGNTDSEEEYRDSFDNDEEDAASFSKACASHYRKVRSGKLPCIIMPNDLYQVFFSPLEEQYKTNSLLGQEKLAIEVAWYKHKLGIAREVASPLTCSAEEYQDFFTNVCRVALANTNQIYLLKQLSKKDKKQSVGQNRRGGFQFDFEALIDQAKHDSSPEMKYLAANVLYFGLSKSGVNRREAKEILDELTKDDQNPFYAEACAMKGHMYYSAAGVGEMQSYSEAADWFEKAAAATTAGSGLERSRIINHLAFMKSVGCGIDFSYKEAESLLRLAVKEAEAEDTGLLLNLARFYASYAQYEEAVEIYEQIYEKDPRAAVELGRIYKSGVHDKQFQPSYKNAKICFEQAANMDSAEGHYELGMLLFRPIGKDRKPEFRKAIPHLATAAKKGISDAGYILGYIYENGSAGDPDKREAIRFYTMAADQGHVEASVALAGILMQEGPACDYKLALYYAAQAHDAGSAFGTRRYADLKLLGRGCKQDATEARGLYEKALAAGAWEAAAMIQMIDKYKLEEFPSRGVFKFENQTL